MITFMRLSAVITTTVLPHPRLLTDIQFQLQGVEGDRSGCKVDGKSLQAQRSIVRNTQVDLGDTGNQRRRSAGIRHIQIYVRFRTDGHPADDATRRVIV